MAPKPSRSPAGCAVLVALGFGFLALMAWTGALADAGNFKSRHMAWLVEHLIVGTMGRGLGAALTACAGIGFAIVIMVVSGRSPKPETKPSPRRTAASVDTESSTSPSTGQRRRTIGPAGGGENELSPSVSGVATVAGEQLPPIDEGRMGMVFVSTAMAQSEARQSITNVILDTDSQSAIDLDKRNASGEPMGPEFFPNEAWATPDTNEREYRTLPNLFYGGGFWFVSAKAAAVFRAHDLGDGALHPVDVYDKDRKTPLGDGWFCINFGNKKPALLAERCAYIRPASGGGWRVNASLKDDEYAVSTAALHGPDIWVDPQLRSGFFFQ